MKKFLKLIFIFLFLYSCNWNKNGILVQIKNYSDEDIYNVSFSTNDSLINLNFENIKSGHTVEEFLDMTNNTKSDGGYIMKFENKNGDLKQIGGGYYTNGGSLNYLVVCEVKNDTVLLKFK